MCGYFCIGFIDFMLKCKSLLEDTILFSPNEYEISGKIILKYLQKILKKVPIKKNYCIVCSKYKKFNNAKLPYIFEKNVNSFYYLQ